MAAGARYRAGECYYDDVASLVADAESYLFHGVIRLATGEVPPRPFEQFPMKLRLTDGNALEVHGEMLAAGANPIIKVVDWTPRCREAVLAATRASSAAPGQAIRTATEAPRAPGPNEAAPSLPSEKFGGALENPVDMAGLRALPLRPDLRVSRISDRPSVCSLLRWLAACRASGVLVIEGPRRLELTWVEGKPVLAERERGPVYEAIMWRTSTYSFEAARPRGPSAAATGAWVIVAGMVKRFLREIPLDALAAALPSTKAPSFDVRGSRLLPALALSAAEQRFLEHRIDGREPISRLTVAAGVSDTAVLRMLALLDLIALVTWEEPQAGSTVVEDPVRELYERRVRGDLFRAVGSHYSESPTRLRRSYDAMRVAHRPGSEAHQRSPVYAAKLVELAERAWATVGERQSRQRYRQEVMNLPVEGLADLLFDQAKMELMRQEVLLARELIEEAIDLYPAPHFYALLEQLKA